jgi:peptidoglycan hydrolase-like protein with peptidoglycan-binding domain
MRVTSSAPASAASSSQPTLRQGAKGAAVVTLQQRLRSAGYNIPADGDFGPRTRAAVVAFQKKHGLAADGVVGPKTWAKLGAGGSSGSGGSGPVLKTGAKGLPVAQLQNRLNQLGFNVGAADGNFGPKTAAGVKAFQKSRGLAADGVVGPRTWAKLGIHASGSVSQTGGTSGSGGLRAGGGWGGTERLGDPAKAIAAQMGLRVTSLKRTAAGSIGSSTSSDHHVSQKNAYAVDIGVRGAKGTELAHRLAKAYGLTPPYIGSYKKHYIKVNGQTFRVQLLWQVKGHYDHVHIGFRRV